MDMFVRTLNKTALKLFRWRHLFVLYYIWTCPSLSVCVCAFACMYPSKYVCVRPESGKCKVYLSNDLIKPFNKFVFLSLFFCSSFSSSIITMIITSPHEMRTRAHHECHLIACNPRRCCVRPFTLIYSRNAQLSSSIHEHTRTHHSHRQTITNRQHAIYFVISTNYLIWFLLVFTVTHARKHMRFYVCSVYNSWHCLRLP